MKTELIEESDDRVKEALISGVRAFNASVLGPNDSRPLVVIARDAAGRIVGGVSGLGDRLMREAEGHAHRRGCTGAQVDTASFQAPGFYEKLRPTPGPRRRETGAGDPATRRGLPDRRDQLG